MANRAQEQFLKTTLSILFFLVFFATEIEAMDQGSEASLQLPYLADEDPDKLFAAVMGDSMVIYAILKAHGKNVTHTNPILAYPNLVQNIANALKKTPWPQKLSPSLVLHYLNGAAGAVCELKDANGFQEFPKKIKFKRLNFPNFSGAVGFINQVFQEAPTPLMIKVKNMKDNFHYYIVIIGLSKNNEQKYWHCVNGRGQTYRVPYINEDRSVSFYDELTIKDGDLRHSWYATQSWFVLVVDS